MAGVDLVRVGELRQPLQGVKEAFGAFPRLDGQVRPRRIADEERVAGEYEAVVDDYAQMVHGLTERFYTRVSRYTTSAFMRLKLGQALEGRGLSAHIYESQREALDAAAEDL